MKIDFSVITIYELLALALSGVTILWNIGRCAYRRCVRPDISFYPNGSISLYSNMSGSYIRFNGMIEAVRSSVIIRNIHIRINREVDEQVLNLEWSTIMSPVSQRITGQYMSTEEQAHPIKIEEGMLSSAFIEYIDPYDSSAAEIAPYIDRLKGKLEEVLSDDKQYQEAYQEYVGSDEFKEAKIALERELFWRVGHYNAIMSINIGNKVKTYTFGFDVSKECFNNAKHNINEALLSYIKDAYRLSYDYKVVMANVE